MSRALRCSPDYGRRCSDVIFDFVSMYLAAVKARYLGVYIEAALYPQRFGFYGHINFHRSFYSQGCRDVGQEDF